MRRLVGAVAAAVALAAAPMAMSTIGTPAVGSAAPMNCGDGQWWDPTANTCRPLGVGPQPLACGDGQWWDPTANTCRPLGVGPQPLSCDNGWWWDPSTNECAPPVVPPAE